MNFKRRSTLIPALLLVYLAVMAWIGRGELVAGHYAYYFSLIGLTLVCIFLLRRNLLKRERRNSERDKSLRK
ncbi:MAG: hypothetical protein K2K55_03255 [Duncaniella sp.]|nr:hypothetical protein [Duncaniella sp.]